MNTGKFLFRSAASLIVLFSASAYAVPILHVNVAGAAADDTSAKYNDGSMSRPEADNVLFPVNPSVWNENINENNLLGNFSGLNLLYGLYSAFATPLLSSPAAGFTIFDLPLGEIAANDDGIGSSEDENTIVGFLATLGVGPTDWGATGESPEAAGQQAQSDQAHNTPLTPRGPRGECPQRHYGQSQKPGLREDSLCFGGGGTTGSGSRGGGGNLAARGSGSGTSPGGGGLPGGVGAGGGGGPGDTGPGGGVGPGGSGPDGVGPGGGDPGSTIPSEVGTVPEPATLVLLGLGLASMFVIRSRRIMPARENHPLGIYSGSV